MSLEDKWDHRYSSQEAVGNACDVLKDNLQLLPSNGRSLDLACGLGANALLLAQQGLESHGWDISTVALDKLQRAAAEKKLSLHTLQRDVENNAPTAASFDVIVVSQFLHRPLCPQLVAALKPGGLLFYQTYHRHKLGDNGPSSKRFLLDSNELLSLFSELELRYYREDSRCGDLTQGLRDLTYFIGQKPL